MASLMSLYGTGSQKQKRASLGCSGTTAWQSPAPVTVSRLLRKLRYSLKRSAARPRRGAARSSFGYDLHSYSQNFDDGSLLAHPAATA
ncbi:unnamed protein product [Urochloa decumbens]|uniref:Uncharacterized protein n=1 Tax=Urochloa decumbens TaxID=240449 RepID=A0ABC8XDQ1_9POAL